MYTQRERERTHTLLFFRGDTSRVELRRRINYAQSIFMCVETDRPSRAFHPSVESPEQRDMLRSTFSAEEEQRERERSEKEKKTLFYKSRFSWMYFAGEQRK